MKHKRMIAALLTVLFLSGCTGLEVPDSQFGLPNQPPAVETQPKPKPAEPVDTLHLAYSLNDGLNPYTMTTKLNRELAPLMYDALVTVNKRFEPEYRLAEQLTMEGRQWTVKFRRDAQFSDGTLLTGQDIVYSMRTAVESQGNWRSLLANVANYTVNADGDVEITLHREDVDFPALLSFPIIKEGTAAADYPIGIGKFFLTGTDGITGLTLSANPIYYGGSGAIETVKLVSASNPDALTFGIKSGEIDLAYSDFSSPGPQSLSSTGLPVSLNNLVYLGINGQSGLLARPQFRRAISLAIGRDELVSKGYSSRARASRYPLHPEFYRMEGFEVSSPRELTEAAALLDEIGLTEKDANRLRIVAGQPVTLSLLVNSESAYRNAAATLLVEQLGQLGIRVNVLSQEYAQYSQTLQNGEYDLYLGETRLLHNMDFSPLLAGGTLGYYTAYSETLDESWRTYKATGEGLEQFCDLFVLESPFVPLLYRQGMLSYAREFQAEVVATEQDIFYNIMEW